MPRITELYAVLSVDENEGNEGVVAVKMGSAMMPLIGADANRLSDIKKMAQAILKKHGGTFKLAKFTVREDMEELQADVTTTEATVRPTGVPESAN
jgi:hypothetical protein